MKIVQAMTAVLLLGLSGAESEAHPLSGCLQVEHLHPWNPFESISLLDSGADDQLPAVEWMTGFMEQSGSGGFFRRAYTITEDGGRVSVETWLSHLRYDGPLPVGKSEGSLFPVVEWDIPISFESVQRIKKDAIRSLLWEATINGKLDAIFPVFDHI